MAKTNIANKLKAAKPQLVLSETDVYDINDDKNSVLMIDELLKKEDTFEGALDVFTLLLGEEAIKDIASKYDGIFDSISQIRVVMIAMMAAIQGLEYEEVEARFLQTTKE